MANAADLRIRITADGAQAAGELNRVNDALRRHGQEATAAQRHAAALRGAFTGLAAATATLYAGFQAAQALVDMVKAMIDAAVATERLTKGFQAITGSQQAAGAEMAYLSEVANRLGLEVTSAGEAYLSLTAAAKGTALQGQAARDVFEAVSLAMAKLGKSSADTQGALLAVEQMISKGKVSAEELRGQLGERLPGAFATAANAMGVTTQELDKLLQTGEVTAEEMLPKLAAELNRLYDDGKEVSGLTAEWNRFTNAMAEAGTAIANNTGLVNLLMAALESAANKAQTLANWLNGEGWNNFATQVDRGNYLLSEKIRLTEEFRQKAQEVAELEGRSLVAEKLFPKLAPAQAELRALGNELGTVTAKMAAMAEGNKQLTASADAAQIATAEQAAATKAQTEAQAQLDREFDLAERQFEALDQAHAKHEKGLARVTKGTKAAAAATTDYAAAVRRLIDQYLPTEAAALRLAETQQLLNEAIAAGAVSEETATEILQAMQAEMNATAREAEQAADGFTQAWQDGVQQLDRSFQGLWRGLMTGQRNSLADLKNMLLEWLADLSYQLLINPLVIPIQGMMLGLMGGGMTGVAGTAMGAVSTAGSMTSAFSGLSSLASSVTSLLSGATFAGLMNGFSAASSIIGASGYFGGFGATMGLASGAASAGSTAFAIGAAAPYLLPAIAAIAAIAALFGSFDDKEPRYGTYSAQVGGQHTSLEDWENGPSSYTQGAFGLTFGLNDLGTKYVDAAELKDAYDQLAQITELLADFFGPELSAQIEQQLASMADERGLIQLNYAEGEFSDAMAALVETIAVAAGQTSDDIGIAFAGMVGDLSGTVEEVSAQIQSAMVATLLTVELSDAYDERLGQMLALTGEITTDTALLRGYIDQFAVSGENSGDTLARLVHQLSLLDTAAQMTATSLEGVSAENLIWLSDQVVEAFGSVEAASQAMAFYYDQFTTDTEKLVDLYQQSARAIENSLGDVYQELSTMLSPEDLAIIGDLMNSSLLQTREGFDYLIASLDLTTEAGQELYAALMLLAPQFDALYDSSEAFTDWLLGVDAVDQATRELEQVFANWGMTIPATRDELLALYAAGAFTAEQMAILGAMVEELGLVFGDVTDSVDQAVNDLIVDYTDLYIRLAEAQGNDALALQLRRQQELAEAADEYSRMLLLQIYAYEDAATAAAEAEAARRAAWEEEQRARRAAYDAEAEAIRSRNAAAQAAADEANRAAREALQSLQQAAEAAYRVANDIANAWLEALSAIGLAAEATALQRRLQAASMDPALRSVYQQVWGIQDRATLAAGQADLAIQALSYLGRDQDATRAERALTMAGTDPALRAFQEWVFTLEDARQAAEEAGAQIRDLIDGLQNVSAALAATIDRVDALRLAPAAMQAQRRADAQAQLAAALSAARAGTMPDLASLEQPLATLGEDPVNQFGDRVSYLRDLGRTRGQLAALQGLVDAQIPIEERNLAALENLPVALYPNFEAIVAAIGTTSEDTAGLLAQANAAITAAIDAMAARDEALRQSITEIVPEIQEIPPYVEEVYEELDTVGNDITTSLSGLRAVLMEIDSNGDELITEAEMIAALEHVLTRDKIHEIFTGLDINQDGVIDAIELSVGNLVPLLQAIDLDGDGLLTWAEFQSSLQYLASDEQLQAIFTELDTNGDGVISELEMMSENLLAGTESTATYLRQIRDDVAIITTQIDRSISLTENLAYYVYEAKGLLTNIAYYTYGTQEHAKTVAGATTQAATLLANIANYTYQAVGLLTNIANYTYQAVGLLTNIAHYTYQPNNLLTKIAYYTYNTDQAVRAGNSRLTTANSLATTANNYLVTTVNWLASLNSHLNNISAYTATSAANSAKDGNSMSQLLTNIAYYTYDTDQAVRAGNSLLTTANSLATTANNYLVTTVNWLASLNNHLSNISSYTSTTANRLANGNSVAELLTNIAYYTYDSKTYLASLLDYAVVSYNRGYATGGIATGPLSGYGVTLHGTEAIIPLGDGNTVTAQLKAPLPPAPNLIAGEAGDSLALRQALAELQAEVAALRADTQVASAATVGELKDHNRRERRRDVVGQKVEVIS